MRRGRGLPARLKFLRVSYALFAVAVLVASLKLGGVLSARPFVLRMVPATPAAGTAETTVGKDPEGKLLNLPETRGAATAGDSPARIPGNDAVPVFDRPSPGPARGSGEPVCGDLGGFPKSSRAIFPLSKDYFGSYEDTWGAPRPQGGHEGTDLMSPAGTPEFALTDGTIVPVSRANDNGWNTLGGYTVMVKAAYDIGPVKKGDLFYYAHLDQKGVLSPGTKVRAGQQVGVVGDTGEGPEGTRGKFPPHLHLGWYAGSSASSRTDLESGAMDPYPLLLWLETYGGAVTGGTDTAYCETPQEPVPEPSAESRTTPNLPGPSPDLDTGGASGARYDLTATESRSRHGRSPEPGAKNGPSAPIERTGVTGGGSKAGPTGEAERDDGAGDERGVTPEPGEDRPAASESDAPHPSDGAETPGVKTRETGSGERTVSHLLSGSVSRPSYASILTDVLHKGTTQDRAEKAGKKDKKHKKSSNPRKEARKPGLDKPEAATGSDQWPVAGHRQDHKGQKSEDEETR